MTRQQQYDQLFDRLDSLCEGETDRVALMATIACELYHAFEQFNWVGFYRNVGGELLKVAPCQGRARLPDDTVLTGRLWQVNRNEKV